MFRVYIDFKSPAAYLALKPTLEIASESGVTVQWTAFRTNQQAVPVARPDEDQGASHRRVRAEARQKMHLHYASVQSLPMRFPSSFSATDLALGVLDALHEYPSMVVDEFVRAAFNAYWVDHADLDQESVVGKLLAANEVAPGLVGEVRENLAQRLDAIASRAVDEGVVDAPAYQVDGQVFVGREHLPWVSQILNELH